MKRLLIMFGFYVAACGADPTLPTVIDSAPTATLQPLPSVTASPIFLTALPTDTPLPTFTPLPTATPIAHIIQQGDTLLGIAIKYDVSMEALEAANPGINPNALQIGQTVFIPPPSGEVVPILAVLPTPLPVTIGSFQCLPASYFSMICLGDFTNTTEQPITNLSVKVSVLDSENAVIDSQVAYAPLSLIPVGATVPLSAGFANDPQLNALAAVLTADSGAALQSRYALLQVSEATGEATPVGFAITVTLTNTQASILNAINVIGTVYNANGVAGYRTIALNEPLAPNDSRQISFALTGVTQITRWIVIAQGRLP